MFGLRRQSMCWLVALFLAASLRPAGAGEQTFPFGSDLMLDASPMRGSKRLPILRFDENGAASIDLWCASLRAQATVGDGTIAIVPGVTDQAQCAPERMAADDNLLAALSEVTNWRRKGDLIELSGATTLRFRLMTN